MNIEKVVFVGGSGRSGTTLVCKLLDLHSATATIFEVWPLISLLHYLRENRLPDTKTDEEVAREHIEYSLSLRTEFNWRVRKEEAIYAWSEKMMDLLAAGQPLQVAIRRWADYLHRLQMVRDGSSRIVHKTPALATYLAEIWELWPSGRFLHMIRDPRDVVASYLSQDWGPTNVRDSVEWYCGRVGPAITHGRGDERYLEIKMESLVETPNQVLEQVQSWAELSPETERILSQIVVNASTARHRRNQLDRDSAKWIYEETVRRIPTLGDLYEP